MFKRLFNLCWVLIYQEIFVHFQLIIADNILSLLYSISWANFNMDFLPPGVHHS